MDRKTLRANFLRLEKDIREGEVQYTRLLEDAESAKANLDREFRDHVVDKTTWIVNLKTIVDDLNTKFNQLMRQIGNVGQWELGNLAKPETDTKLMELQINLTASFAKRQDGCVGDLLQMPRLSVRSQRSLVARSLVSAEKNVSLFVSSLCSTHVREETTCVVVCALSVACALSVVCANLFPASPLSAACTTAGVT